MITVLYDGLGYLFEDFDGISHVERHFGIYYLAEEDEIRLFAFGDIELDFIVSEDRKIIAPTDIYGNPTRIKIKPKNTIFEHQKSGNRLRILSMDDEELVEAGERFRAMDNQIKPNNLIVLDAPKKPTIADNEETPLTKSERTTYQNIIVSLLDYIRGNVPLAEKHPSFTSESDMIAAIEKHFKGYQGLSETTLKRKFAEAKKSFDEQ